jgi:glutamate-ammonia-ligase adenylyltransferase
MLTPVELSALFESVPFGSRSNTEKSITRLLALVQSSDSSPVANLLAGWFTRLADLLAGSANPDKTLLLLERFLEHQPAICQQLLTQPADLDVLIALFSSSQYFSQILLNNPQYFATLTERHNLSIFKTVAYLRQEQAIALRNQNSLTEQIIALQQCQRREELRIGVCDLLGLFDFERVVQQLSNLAESLIQTALNLAIQHSGFSPQHLQNAGFVVLALGKLGGAELNYSSDIDLIFIADAQAAELVPVGEKIIDVLTRVTQQGFLYRVDMRLRPWGQASPLVTNLRSYINYFNKNARLWEKQALLKARPVAGNLTRGQTYLAEVYPLLFEFEAERIRADVHAMKQKTEQELRKAGRIHGEVKRGIGGIRDIEFTTQVLQLIHGAHHPQLHTPTTLVALHRLLAFGILPAEDHAVLTSGYLFLRTVEHHLQIQHYHQTHHLPTDPAALQQLALRLGYRDSHSLTQRYQQHSAAIRAVYRKYLELAPVTPDSNIPIVSPEKVRRHLARLDASYRTAFAEPEIALHTQLSEELDRTQQVQVHTLPLEEDLWKLTIVGYDYVGALSVICGLLAVHRINILGGDVFTYEHSAQPQSSGLQIKGARYRRVPGVTTNNRAKIVDVFTVRCMQAPASTQIWQAYTQELRELTNLLHQGKPQQAQGKLANRVAGVLRQPGNEPAGVLLPLDIEIDNTASENYTLLRIQTTDTVGFLYEFTSGLALFRVNIVRMEIVTAGNRIEDRLYVTASNGKKITNPKHQQELRVAAVLIKHFTHLLPSAPNPEAALVAFGEFIGDLFRRHDWSRELLSLEQPQVLGGLVQLLGASEFLWEDFLRMQYTNLFPVLSDWQALEQPKSVETLHAELFAELADSPDWRKTLNAFKDREMFRTDMRRIQGKIVGYGRFSAELSGLVEVVFQTAFDQVYAELKALYGEPRLPDGSICPVVVCGLGKFGGRELGFASDIELMLCFEAEGDTDGAQTIRNSEFFDRMVQNLKAAIWAKQEGIFEIDLRLRPYGKHGRLAVSLEAFERYYAPQGAAWSFERQALIRLRPICGSAEFGERLLMLRDQYVFTEYGFDVSAMRAMRERQMRHLVAGGSLNVKFSAGGLADLEYLVQGLQIRFGLQHPSLRTPSIRTAIQELHQLGILSESQFLQLKDAHNFLRKVIDALRVVRGNAKDVTVPASHTPEFSYLARRLKYNDATATLQADLNNHTKFVQQLSQEMLGNG